MAVDDFEQTGPDRRKKLSGPVFWANLPLTIKTRDQHTLCSSWKRPRCRRRNMEPPGNPSPAVITDAMWNFWLGLKSLEPNSLLSGIYAAKPGYHNTRRGNRPGDYSVRDAVDTEGPADKSAAIDWTFPDAQRGDYRTIRIYGVRVEKAFETDDPRMWAVREALGQSDSDEVAEGYDFRTRRTRTPSKSHVWHWHFSFNRRDVEDPKGYKDCLSVLSGESLEEWKKKNSPETPLDAVLTLDTLLGDNYATGYELRTVGHVLADLSNLRDGLLRKPLEKMDHNGEPFWPEESVIGLLVRFLQREMQPDCQPKRKGKPDVE